MRRKGWLVRFMDDALALCVCMAGAVIAVSVAVVADMIGRQQAQPVPEPVRKDPPHKLKGPHLFSGPFSLN